MSNTITGGVFFGAVIQGRDVQVMLPAEVTPAMTGLPRPAAVFTGRDDELETLLKGLSPHGPGGAVLVAGMGGIGKTELVLQTAYRALHTTDWFPGGVLFVDLFGYDPNRRLSAADALLGWLQAIGIPGEHIPAAEADRARLWRSVLAAYVRQGRRLLLIIDNAADAAQVVPLLPTGAEVPVLITSRHTLDIDARLHDLEVLAVDPAVDLVCEVITHRRGDTDPRVQDRQAMVELVELCAGLPLALRIVAALLADRPHLQPAALAQELDDARHRLDRLSREQVAVRAAFDLSYQRLTGEQARLFRLLPVNPGPDIGTAAAARLADLPQGQATILLQDLHRAHLVDEPAPDRWRMHDLLRLYAGEQPPETTDETATARVRLFTYYQDSARAADTHLHPTAAADTTGFTTREQALAWLDAEHANLIAVCTSAPGHQLPRTSTDLAFSLSRFLDFRRYFDDWITITTTAVEIFRQTDDRHGEGMALNNLGNALQEVRRFDEAITALTQAVEIFRQTDDRHGEGVALNSLGLALREVRRFDEAITAHTQAVEIYRQTDDRHGEGMALNNLGLALREVRRFDEAITAHTQAVEIYRQTDDRHGEGVALNNLGNALQEVRRFDEAITAHTQAVEIYRQTDDRHGEGMALNNLGHALQEVRRFDEAITAHTQAVEIYRQTDDRHGEGVALNNLGNALQEVRRFDEAITAHTQAVEIYRQTDDRHGEGVALNNLGNALREVRRFDEAITAHTQAVEIFRQTDDRHGEGVALAGLGLALREVRRFDDARSSWGAAIDAFIDSGDAASAALIRRWLDELPPGPMTTD